LVNRSVLLLIGVFIYPYTCWNVTRSCSFKMKLFIDQNWFFFFSLDSVPYPWSKSADCRTLLIADFLTAKTWLFPNPCSSIVQITKLMWQTCSVFQELQHTCHQIEARMHKSSLYFGSRTDDWNYFLLLTNSPFSRDKLLCSAVNETLGY